MSMKLKLELIIVHTADPERGRALNNAAVLEGNRRLKYMGALPPHLDLRAIAKKQERSNHGNTR